MTKNIDIKGWLLELAEYAENEGHMLEAMSKSHLGLDMDVVRDSQERINEQCELLAGRLYYMIEKNVEGK